tara:strand:+ start:60464 stop:61564 length:1101 start_codon:yes stop_codon:yes gene_type:complete
MLKFIKKFYANKIYPHDPDNMWFIHSLRTTVAGVIGAAIMLFTPMPQPLWLLLTLFFTVMLKPLLGSNCILRKRNLIIYGVLQAVYIFAFSYLANNFWVMVVGVFVLTAILFYLLRFGPPFIGIVMTTIALAALALGFPASVQDSAWRLVSSLSGVLIGYIFAYYIWPDRLRYAVRKNLVCFTHDLATYCCWMIRDTLRGGHYETRYTELRLQAYRRYVRLQQLVEEQPYLPKRYRCTRDFAKIIRCQRLFYEVTIILENFFTHLQRDSYLEGLFTLLSKLSDDVLDLSQQLQLRMALKPAELDMTAFNQSVFELEGRIQETLMDSSSNSTSSGVIVCEWSNFVAVLQNLQHAMQRLVEATDEVMV